MPQNNDDRTRPPDIRDYMGGDKPLRDRAWIKKKFGISEGAINHAEQDPDYPLGFLRWGAKTKRYPEDYVIAWVWFVTEVRGAVWIPKGKRENDEVA